MSLLTKELLEEFLNIAGDKLSGDWIVIGGTVLPLIGITYRVTVDIDFIGKTELQQTQNIELMNIVTELGLPVENINQAGAYFLSKIDNFEEHLILIHQGSSASIFRPNLFLYLQLKLNRLSETDFTDCVQYIKYSKENHELDSIKTECKNLLEDYIKKPLSKIKKEYIEKLLFTLKTK